MADDHDDDFEPLTEEQLAQFERLYDYYPFVLGLMRRLGFPPETAEDLTQDTFLRVFKAMRNYRAESVLQFLDTTARHVVANHFRFLHAGKRFAKETISIEKILDLAELSPSPEHVAAVGERVAQVIEALEQLRPDERTVLLMAVQGLTYEEMGQVLDASVSKIKDLLNKARKHLKDLLRDDPPEPGGE